MTIRRLLVLSVLAPGLLLGCGEEGREVVCPDLTLYNVRDGGLPPAVLEQAVRLGCLSAPVAVEAKEKDAGQDAAHP